MSATSSAAPRTLAQFQEYCRSHFGELSTQYQQGVRYLMDHPDEVPISSMRAIAGRAGVQPATLVRLAQHLGFDGWQSLRALFVEDFRGSHQPYASRARKVVRKGGSSRLLDDIVQAQHQNLEAMRAQAQAGLASAAELLGQAQSVHVAGFRACFPVACTFHYLYRLFRKSVHLVRADAGALEMELRAFERQDAVLVISFAPYSQEVLRVVEAAGAAGCRVVALTDSSVSPLALQADCTVLFSVESPSFFPSITAGVAAAEALVEQLLAREGKGAVKALEAAEGQLHRMGAYVTARRR
ncbi:MurR/RpiR family transcriptional regulator [Bordetella genomosp. 13]|uniref:DNA-binding protein n=1 Tax=Bordetella genomosp. 13 TaxID=463040 RepID=A0A1W6Z8W8_9BORD|nr:MurR/RpiR family transcriptional regulator [Bordetella genomosp. 13]ARP93823.1 DNA-binding protein [Bordetella genomosp. 13]